MKNYIFVFFFIFFALFFVACQEEQTTFVVSFETQTSEKIVSQSILPNQKVTEPEEPSRDGYVFDYWYIDNVDLAFDFNNLVSSDITLNAHWTKMVNVNFYSADATLHLSVSIIEGSLLDRPDHPIKEDHTFLYWYEESEDIPFDFDEALTSDKNLYAKWELNESGIMKLIQEDIAYVEENLFQSPYQMNLFKRGNINNSSISWIITSKYITSTGLIVRTDLENPIVDMPARFYLDGVLIEHIFKVDLSLPESLDLEVVRNVPFQNLTTEYEVADSSLDLYFENNSFVPYVKLMDFFNLMYGFIDSEVNFSFSNDGDNYTIEYQYYDEDEDYTYDLILTVNIVENTITVNDPGFFWAYVYSTETNYGRHIEYLNEHPDESYIEGSDIVFDIDQYGMDAVEIDNQLVLPFYLVNQLFVGSSYYNVYYNYDGLYGIYSTPAEGSDEYNLIKTSSVNGKALPADLVVHNFNMLAFNLDHFYGLREIKEVETYYDLLFKSKNLLLSTSAETFDNALFNLIYKTFDEPHTSSGMSSYYNKLSWGSPSLTSLDQLGDRYLSFYEDGLYAVDDAIFAKWRIYTSGWTASARPKYWFVDQEKTTVVLALDDFLTSDIQESELYDPSLISEVMTDFTTPLIPSINFGSKFFYYNSSSTEDQFVEILIKGVTQTDFDNYNSLLMAEGFSLAEDIYIKTIDSKSVAVKIVYSSEYQALYVGIVEDKGSELGVSSYFITDLIDIIYADSAVYLEFMLEEIIEENPLVNQIVLDLTFNLGGNVGALYRVVGFITDDPFKVSSISLGSGSMSTSYIDISGITSYDHLQWALLTSPATFSAGNSLATIFMENEFGPIMGMKSGGGTASITPVLLPNGTTFTMSSNNLNAYRSGLGTTEDPYVYHHNEFGIVPDYEVSIDLLYDNDTIMNNLMDFYK